MTKTKARATNFFSTKSSVFSPGLFLFSSPKKFGPRPELIRIFSGPARILSGSENFRPDSSLVVGGLSVLVVPPSASCRN